MSDYKNEKEPSAARESENVASMSGEIFAADHDPPIGTGGGSFYLEFPVDKVIIPDAADGKNAFYGAEYEKYPFSERISGSQVRPKNYTGISRIEVLTEKADGSVAFNRHVLQNAVRVNLWLTGNTSDSPDIIVQGSDGGAAFTRKKLKQSSSGKKSRLRYYHKSDDPKEAENSDRPEIKLQKWQAVNGANPPVVLAEDSGQDSFYLYMYFSHP